MHGVTCAGTWVTGTGTDGKPREVYLHHVVDNAWSMAEYGSQAVVWQTAVNPVVALELVAVGRVVGRGRARPRGLPGRSVPRPPRRARRTVGSRRTDARAPLTSVRSESGRARRARAATTPAVGHRSRGHAGRARGRARTAPPRWRRGSCVLSATRRASACAAANCSSRRRRRRVQCKIPAAAAQPSSSASAPSANARAVVTPPPPSSLPSVREGVLRTRAPTRVGPCGQSSGAGTTRTGTVERCRSLWGTEPRMAPTMGRSPLPPTTMTRALAFERRLEQRLDGPQRGHDRLDRDRRVDGLRLAHRRRRAWSLPIFSSWFL